MEIIHPPYFSLRIISRKLGRLEAKTCAKLLVRYSNIRLIFDLSLELSRKDSGRLKTVAVGCAYFL
jgi:hypothetical protein